MAALAVVVAARCFTIAAAARRSTLNEPLRKMSTTCLNVAIAMGSPLRSRVRPPPGPRACRPIPADHRARRERYGGTKAVVVEHVGLDESRAVAELVRERPALLLGHVGDHDLRARLDEPADRRRTEPSGATDNKCART